MTACLNIAVVGHPPSHRRQETGHDPSRKVHRVAGGVYNMRADVCAKSQLAATAFYDYEDDVPSFGKHQSINYAEAASVAISGTLQALLLFLPCDVCFIDYAETTPNLEDSAGRFRVSLRLPPLIPDPCPCSLGLTVSSSILAAARPLYPSFRSAWGGALAADACCNSGLKK